MQNLWAYYPLLFVLFFLVALIVWTYKYAIALDKCTQEEKAKAETQYNLDRLMNNKTGNCDEIDIVNTLSQYEFKYKPTK